MHVTGVSPMVDSCSRLVYQKAKKTFSRISPENRRWIDLDDVIQDGLIEAWQASRRYVDGRGERLSKFSSYLYRGLDMALSGRYGMPLRQKKRTAALLELDALLPGTQMRPDIPDRRLSPEELYAAISVVTQLCRSVSPAALSFLLAVMSVVSAQTVVSGRRRRSRLVSFSRRTREAIQCIPEACIRHRVRREDMDLVLSRPEAVGLVLEGVVQDRDLRAEEDAKVLACVGCSERFSLSDVRKGLYWARSLTCKSCLDKLFASGPENSCFGREKEVHNTRTVTEGYSEADAECRLHCRDKAACVRYIEERRKTMSEATDTLEVDVDDVDFTGIDAGSEVPEETGTTKSTKHAKGVKVAKSAKTAKAAKTAKPTKTAKTVTPEKPAKAAKSAKTEKSAKAAKTEKPAKERSQRKQKSTEKIDPKVALKQGLIKLDEQGRDLPFKSGSFMRWAVEQALEPGGVSEATLEKAAVKQGYNFKFQLAVLLSGKSGDSSLRPYPSTHTWKVERDEKKHTIRLYDLKRIAYYEKMARLDGR